MLDLVDILKTDDQNHTDMSSDTNCALFYQTSSCHQLVSEAFRYEGLVLPATHALSDSVVEHIDAGIELVFIELTQSTDVVDEAARLMPQIPANLSVVIVGQENKISTIRELKEMGLYYLFWPIRKEELIDFTHSVMESRQGIRGFGNKRKAKQVAVISTKGGMGSTLISCEIAQILSDEKKVPTLLVDHGYSAGNMDIMLGLKQYQKRVVSPGTLVSSIDNTYAAGLIKNISERLSLLALESDEMTAQGLNEYTRVIKQQVVYDTNVIVEDYGNQISSVLEIEALVDQADTVIIVFDSTVSSLRDLNRMTALIAKYNKNEKTRVINVMNCSRPNATASITNKDIERYFTQGVDVTIPFDVRTNERVLTGEKVHRSNSSMAAPLQSLVANLLGEQFESGDVGVLERVKNWIVS